MIAVSVCAFCSISRRFKLVGIALCLAAIACLSACKLETEPANGLPGEITAFDLLKVDNPGLPQDVTGSISGDNISLDLAADSDVTSLVPSILYKGSGISPGIGEAQDFSDPVTYTVLTPEGHEHAYSVSAVKAASSSKEILRFLIDESRGTINGSDITLTMPFGTDVSALRGSIVHNGKSVSPTSGSTQDFSQPVEYTVTAADRSTKTYRVIVSVAPNDAKDITAFAIGDTTADINGTQITLALPFGTDVRTLEPIITHTGVSVDPADGSAQDFRGPVTYTVTAADGTTQQYTVLVSITPNGAKAITRFAIAGRPAAINGTSISLTLPFGTDLAHLRPTVQHTGKSLSPLSGLEQDFTQPVVYTVSAADGSTTQYTVTLSVAPNTAKDITGFQILGGSADIAGTAITLTLPNGTAVSALVPTISHTGSTIEPASGVAQDFTSPVSYVVTAADGSTRSYSVTVTVAASDAKNITQFRVLGVLANITGDAIEVTEPFGTDVSSVVPDITHTGVSITPAIGVARDFRSAQMYTVTAQDGSTHVYTVTVTITRNSAKEITRFTLLAMNAAINGSAITLTVPFGTNVSSLTPTIIHTGASVAPLESVGQDFRQPVMYTVTAADSSTTVYTVTVTVTKNNAKDITSFRVSNLQAMIGTNTITLELPLGTSLSSLTPTIVTSGVSVSPDSGVARNFTSAVTYTVTAEDLTTKQYVVTLTVAKSSAKLITSFEINDVQGSIMGTAITLTLPHGTDLHTLTPTILHSASSVVSPLSGVVHDFSAPVVYRVTAEDNSFQDYTVTVSLAPASSTKDILTFNILNVVPTIGTETIGITVPAGTTPLSFAPVITINGVSVTPASNESKDFASPVVYTVTAEDGSMKMYTVTVTVAP